jgi:penicillin amidase
MLDERTVLRAMRGEVTVAEACVAAGGDEAEFRRERDALLRRRLPPGEMRLKGAIGAEVEILRDRRGVPHIFARTAEDRFFGLGLAMAQDRLWQMDLMRRRGLGTMAEVLGPTYLPSDVAHRTLGLDRVAAREAERLEASTARVLAAFVAGINRWLEGAGDNLPIEFDLLEYRPAPWTPRDVIAALRGFWWSLNGRLQTIVVGEAAKLLPEGPLRDVFLTPNLPDERILPPDAAYPSPDLVPEPPNPPERPFAGSDAGTAGSNNWAVGGRRTASGSAVLGSDPHQPFQLPANWYECHLAGPEDDVAGAAWAGAPGVWFGRNRRIAWGLTNNGASTRDLYVEEVDPSDPGRYRDGAVWPTFAERPVEIAVRGRPSEHLVVRATVRGPLVNRLIPSVAEGGDPPLSLRWTGLEHFDDLKALLAVNRARDWGEFRAALRDWAIPTFNWGYADVDGNVGYQCAARLPLRGRAERGFRRADEPADRWRGYAPFDAQPHSFNPARGFTSSANNAPVPDDYPYPYVGAFAGGERATRIRETLEVADAFDDRACAALQNDTLSVQARQLVPPLLRCLGRLADADARLLADHLAGWDYRYEPDAVAPACFEMFLRHWNARVAGEQFPAHLVALVAGQGGVAARLLESDDLPWFRTDKDEALREAARRAAGELRERFGPEPSGWAWRNVHRAHFVHPLATPATADVFDVGPAAVSGAATTVRNTGLGAGRVFAAESGAEYRLIADLADPGRLRSTLNLGQSGQPGSPHYRDQFADWVRGDYHALALDRATIAAEQTAFVLVEPL